MAWRRPGDKPLSGPMMVRLQMHICVTWPQWLNSLNALSEIWGELWYANIGKWFATFQVTPHTKRMRGDLKICRFAIRSWMHDFRLWNDCFCFAGTFSTESPLICMYEQNVYTLEPGKVQVRTFQVRKLTFCMPFLVTIKPLLSFVDRNSDLYSTSATPMMCTMSYYVTPRYYSTRLYFNKILFEILIFICKMWSVLSKLKCIKYKD